MMQPASIYKALLTFQNTATDMLVGHLKHFCLFKTCLPMALCPILKLCIHVCVYLFICVCVCMYGCQPEGCFDPQSVLHSIKSKA
jgi:hypothetical protein